MATTEQDRVRHAVPRLRSFAYAVELEELASPQPLSGGEIANVQLSDEQLAQLLIDWQQEPGVSVAADLVSSAVANGKPDSALEAARFLFDNEDAPAVARRIAGVCLGEVNPREISPGVLAVHAEVFSTVDKLGAQIRRTRQQLNRYPADAVLWTNLATLYVSLGQRRQARRAIRAALSLAPQNRFVLRSAARVLLHLEERDEALAILRRAEALKADPWMLSAEISVAAANETQSEHIKLAEQLLERDKFSPRDSSELAAEVATIRALDGSVWAAKKLLRRALKAPCENAWAQAVWLARIPGMPAFDVNQTISHEANALLNRQLGKLRLSMIQTQHWLDDQPFSSRPAQMGSFIASRADRDDVAIKFAEQGLRTNPGHTILLNNLAFSSARTGDLETAKASLRRIPLVNLTENERFVVCATQGLVAFREGDFAQGRSLYRAAIRAFRDMNDIREAIALTYLALEEARVGSPHANSVQREALELAIKKLNQPEDVPLLQELENIGKPRERSKRGPSVPLK